MTLFSPTLWLCINRFGILLKKRQICKDLSTQKFVTFHRNNRTIPSTTPFLHIPDVTSKKSPRYLKPLEKKEKLHQHHFSFYETLYFWNVLFFASVFAIFLHWSCFLALTVSQALDLALWFWLWLWFSDSASVCASNGFATNSSLGDHTSHWFATFKLT